MSTPPPRTDTNPAELSYTMATSSSGVFFTPQLPGVFDDPSLLEGASLPPWPWVQTIRARLPDGREITPTPQGPSLRFIPPLPAGAEIISNNPHGDVQVLHTITPTPPKPPSEHLPEGVLEDEHEQP